MNSVDPAMPFQRDLARESDMQQSRISMFETPGAANMTLETIAKVAAGLRVGVVIKFVPFSEMLRWENLFSPDTFNVVRLPEDGEFLNPSLSPIAEEINPFGSLSAAADNELAAIPCSEKATQGSLSVASPGYAANEKAIGA